MLCDSPTLPTVSVWVLKASRTLGPADAQQCLRGGAQVAADWDDGATCQVTEVTPDGCSRNETENKSCSLERELALPDCMAGEGGKQEIKI